MMGGRRYGTTIRCECGWVPNPEGKTLYSRLRASNEAPSAGGESCANDLYQQHISDILTITDAPSRG